MQLLDRKCKVQSCSLSQSQRQVAQEPDAMSAGDQHLISHFDRYKKKNHILKLEYINAYLGYSAHKL